MLEHCTLPRTGALEIILEVLGDKTKNGGGAMNNGLNNSQSGHAINKICDVTIAYPEGKPLDLFQIAAGYREPCATHVHYRLFDVKDVSFFCIFLKIIFKWPTDEPKLNRNLKHLEIQKMKICSKVRFFISCMSTIKNRLLFLINEFDLIIS